MERPDFIAVVDADPESGSYGEIVHETPMPYLGDELHHFGWNRCSSACHGPDRSHLIVPGFRSSRIYVLSVAGDPRRPQVESVIEAEELAERTGYTRPHTVHCMPGDDVVVSMLGDRDGAGASGFAVLDAQTFEVKGRWENGGPHPPLNYDFWYQPRKNVMVSSEVRRAERLRAGLRDGRRECGPIRAAPPLLGPGRAAPRPDAGPRRGGPGAAGGPLAPRPRRGSGIRRRDAGEQHPALFIARTGRSARSR